MLGHIFLKLFMIVKLQTKFEDCTKKTKKRISILISYTEKRLT